jgi:hypothetical protein
VGIIRYSLFVIRAKLETHSELNTGNSELRAQFNGAVSREFPVMSRE